MNGKSLPLVGRLAWPFIVVLGTVFTVGALTTAGAGTATRELTVEEPELARTPDDQWTVVTLGSALPEVPLGAPAVPSIRLRIPIEAGEVLTDVSLEVLAEELIELRRPVKPYAGEMSSLDLVPPTHEALEAYYPADTFYPAVGAEVVGTVTLSGNERVGIVRVTPLQATAQGRQLRWLKHVRLTLRTELEQAVEDRLQRERTLRLTAPGDGGGRGRLLMAEHGFLPESIPSVEGSPVQYVIISPPDEAMKQEWQRLADWKTATGIPALVVDTDWINEHYPAGSDLAERMRHFIRDGYVNWGLKWVLFGGDVTLVPTRYARSWSYNTGSPLGTDVATDYYFACLDGTWDADQDGIYGESTRYDNIGDDVDFVPEVQVGRVSAKSTEDVTAFLEKYFIYVGNAPNSPTTDGYLDKILFLGEVLFHKRWEVHGNNGQPDCGSGLECNEDDCRMYRETNASGQSYETLVCANYDGADDVWRLENVLNNELQSPFELHYLLERDYHWEVERPDAAPTMGPQNYETTIEAMSGGYGCVHHIGHGDRDRWAIGDGRLLISDLARITNGNAGGAGHFYWVYGTNCNSAAIDYDSFGEHFLMMPGHGVIAYIGCTNVDFPTTARAFSEDFYRFVLETPSGTIGDGYFGSSAANALTGASINTESTRRFLLYALTLLGDPGMIIWPGTPGDMTASFDTAPQMGAGTLTVTVSDGAPVEGAKVCVWKEGEVYSVAQTEADGVADLPFWAATEGEFQVTVISPRHRPIIDGGTVTAPSGPALVLGEMSIVDNGDFGSDGNGDGAIDRDETVALVLTLSNDGDADAHGVQVTLSETAETPDGVIEILSGTWSPGTMGPDQAVTSTSELVVQVATNPPEELFGDGDRIVVPLDLQLGSAEGNFTSRIEFSVFRPRFVMAVNEWPVSSGSEREVLIGVQNVGKGTASNLKALLIGENTYVYVSNSTLYPEDIAPGETALLGPYELSVTDANLGMMTFSLYDIIVSPGEPLHQRPVDLSFPTPPDSLGTIGLPDGMVLGWSEGGAGEALSGYRVYRADEGSSEFQVIHGGILGDHRRMTDEGLAHLAQYRYTIRTVDEGGNLGLPSDVVESYTSPGMAAGWPNFFNEGYRGSPLICELDNVSTIYGNRALREIVFPGDGLYVYHGNGIEMVDGDGVASTAGPFSDSGANFYGKPAAGDLENDGEMDVVAISSADSTVYCWNLYGDEPKWAFKYPATFAWNSPALADLDNNGKLEVIFIGGAGGREGIYVLSHDGAPYKPGTDGKIVDLGARYTYHAPAVGDVDGDGFRDIVIGTREGRLFAVEGRSGIAVPNFEGGIDFATLGYPGGCRSPATLANVDAVPGDEIFVLTRNALFCVGRDGTKLWQKDHSVPFPTTTSWDIHPEPVLGDINADGQLDVAYIEADGRLCVYHAIDGRPVSPFPVQLPIDPELRYGSCILANVDQDPRPEIIFGDSKNHVHAYTHQGQVARGYPIQFTGKMDIKSLAAWDVDDDGYQNLVVQAESVQNLGVFHMEGVVFDPDHNPWPMRRRDSVSSGLWTSSAAVPVALYIEQATVAPDGRVTISWRSGEPVARFHVYRSGPAGPDYELIGSVLGISGEGSHAYRFEDPVPGPGVYRYEIRPVSLGGEEETGSRFTLEVGSGPVSRLALGRVAPNPLVGGRPGTIQFSLPGAASADTPVRLKVVDLQGRALRTLIDGEASAGTHTVEWDGRDNGGHLLPTGLYLIRLESGVRAENTRVLLVR